MRKAKSIDMTSGPLLSPLISFILPLIGASLFQQLYNTVDFLFVGNLLDRTAAAAVGASSSLITVTIGLFTGISVGTSVVASKAMGAGDRERAEKALHTSVTFGLVGGLVIMALTILFSPAILRLLRTPESVMPEALTYLRIYMLSLPFMVVYNMISGGMRAYGDSHTPFVILVICGFVNVLMDAVFIVWIPLGVAGVSIATVISQGLSAVLAVLWAARPETPLRLTRGGLGVDGKVLGQVLRIGLPTGIQTIIITFSNMMVQYYINAFGETAVAAFATYYKVENFIYLPILAFGQAATTFAGQNTGAGNYARIRRGTLVTAAVGTGVVLLISGLILIFPRTVFTWFMKDPEVVTNALKIALVTFPFYWVYPIMEVLGGSVRGMGYAVRSMVLIILNLCVLRVGLLALFSATFHTISSLGAVYPITWATAAVCFGVTFWLIIRKKCGEEGLLPE
ncbi:MAG: MATE family efflux transporter [Firmicutes bacterium]|nr:MATE family efflux transporter [Bacillota bacterium]